MEGHARSWPRWRMEGHAPSWSRLGSTVCARHGRDGARPCRPQMQRQASLSAPLAAAQAASLAPPPPFAHNGRSSRSMGLATLRLACGHPSSSPPARKRPTPSRMATVYGYRLRFVSRGTGAGPCGRGYSRVPQAAVMWEAHACVRGWCRAVIRADAPAAGASLCTDLARRERPLAQSHDSLTSLRSHLSKSLAYLPQPPPGPRQAAFAWAPGPTSTPSGEPDPYPLQPPRPLRPTLPGPSPRRIPRRPGPLVLVYG
jgi:hypothetical protein